MENKFAYKLLISQRFARKHDRIVIYYNDIL